MVACKRDTMYDDHHTTFTSTRHMYESCFPSSSHKAGSAEAHSMAADLVAVATCFSELWQPTKPAPITPRPRLHVDCQQFLDTSHESEGCLL